MQINGRETEKNDVSHVDSIYFSFSLKQEIHDLRQKIEIQSTESDENQNTLRRRYQDAISELTSQVEALGKGRSK